jgi:hypothetical protein
MLMKIAWACRLLAGMVSCLILLAGADPAARAQATSPQGREGPSDLRLDLADPTLAYPVQVDALAPERVKFIEIKLGELRNPGRVRLVFELSYQQPMGGTTLLGTFSPFPPDNPGTYLVATRGMLRAGGTILLTMVPLDQVGPGDRVQVAVEAISFRAE